MALSQWTGSNESTCNPGGIGYSSKLGWEDPLEEEHQPIPVSLPGESYGQRSLEGYSPEDHKYSDITEVTEHVFETVLSTNPKFKKAVISFAGKTDVLGKFHLGISYSATDPEINVNQ